MDRNTRAMGLRTLVVIEVILAAGLVIWTLSGSVWGSSALVAAVIAAAGLVRVRGRQSLFGRLAGRLSFSWSRIRRDAADLSPAPFDIPLATPGAHTAAQRSSAPTTIGARWVGDTLVTVVRIDPGGPAVTYLTPGNSTLADPAGQVVPLDTLAACINPYDIRLSSIEVISHGVRVWGSGVAPATYDRTLGPLSATAQRSVFVVLRLNPLDCADAVARRGGGAAGALRTATVTTRRVAKRLAESGLSTTILSAGQITAIGTQLTEGASLDSLTEEWGSVGVAGLRMRSAAVEPDALGAVLRDIWVNPAVSTTVTVRLRHVPAERRRRDGRSTVEVSGVVRFNEFPAAHRALSSWPAGLKPLDGCQFDALAVGLPIATPTRLDRNLPALTGSDADEFLASVRLPAGGCGQLIGADHAGRAVATRLLGPGISTVSVAAGIHVVAQIALRAVAIGAAVRVHTDRPHRWTPVVAAIGDPGALSLAADRTPTRPGPALVIVDGVAPPPPQADTTRLIVVAPGLGDPDGGSTVALRQNPRAPQDISLDAGGQTILVTMVATPDEWNLIGGYPEPTANAPTVTIRR
ncbi:type VII secretion protein EccE [Gordonia jinghuaiqii]|uniref:Type VII secretion protein EccE n=1 Tax=Gordonia jinghuaiqii TaxID=2758710 RepID=A0A7D7LPY1_9ACTN|nr:type VII secretion protein EccE [Gordonia jinghuaiqii]MCR5976983.1 type VII secretion protein EccE [Gordonia jinghuaiqii]QMT00405.1 type VII secretion protein EccE [Gordonia jinghuaiqii]